MKSDVPHDRLDNSAKRAATVSPSRFAIAAGEQYLSHWNTEWCEANGVQPSAQVVTRIASGPWDAAEIATFLTGARIPVRLATNGSSGPLVQSLWFTSDGLTLLCCTQKSSVLTRRLERDDRVGFEVAGDTPPYRGVRGTGVAQLVDHDVETTLRALIYRYQGQERTPLSDWLLSRIDSEIAIRIEPRTIASWDYSSRMSSDS